MESPPSLNPYQAPESQQVAGLANAPLDYHFREMKIFAWLAGACIAVNVPYTILVFLLSAQVVTFPMESLELVDGLHGIAFLVGVVFYCMWKYRCACNARYFYGGPLLYTPGWCVGYYFIPIMLLFRPYQCMKDIYEKTYFMIGHKAPVAAILTWWLTWILAGVVERVALASGEYAAVVLSHALTLLSSLLVLWVIFTLTRRQYEIVNDPELAAKIGTMDPSKRLQQAMTGVPMQRAQLPTTEATIPEAPKPE